MKGFFLGVIISVLVVLLFIFKPTETVDQKLVLSEENVVVDVAEKVSPSVVTVSVKKDRLVTEPFSFDPFGVFQIPQEGKKETIQRDIGTGFVVSEEGLIVTNKHVVSDLQAEYRVIDKDDAEYEVERVYRDPVNDLAIIKIEPKPGKKISAVELGDSNSLKVGQFVIAIGTALGEFRHTVTTGVISGLGRGIQAGNELGGGIETLDDVIQTDAAINPGNSGGPLLDRNGRVIGVNVAVAGGAQNIGFALPINVIKESLANFKETGQFNRPQFGVRYRMLDQETARLNDVPEGAYIVEVAGDSTADRAGVKKGDIITSLDGEKMKNIKGSLAAVIGRKKAGDKLEIELWRSGGAVKTTAVLEEAK